MSLTQRIKEAWSESSRAFSGTEVFWNRSAASLALVRDIQRWALPHARGRLLDAGAGTLPYRQLFHSQITEYRSIDLQRTHPDLDWVGDIQQLPLPDQQFDTVFSAEVLEHVPDPLRALQEFFRVLKPGGHVLLTVPHLGYLHNEPNDYYRYTKYGMRILLERAGFHVLLVEPSGGIVSFLQHVIATTAVGLTYTLPGLWHLTYGMLWVTGRLAVWVDDHTDRQKLFALHYVAVARRPASG